MVGNQRKATKGLAERCKSVMLLQLLTIASAGDRKSMSPWWCQVSYQIEQKKEAVDIFYQSCHVELSWQSIKCYLRIASLMNTCLKMSYFHAYTKYDKNNNLLLCTYTAFGKCKNEIAAKTTSIVNVWVQKHGFTLKNQFVVNGK